jgi:heme o synthase
MRSELEPQGTIVLERSRFADYVTLTKPELTFLSVLTALAGVLLASQGEISLTVLAHVLLGTALVGGGAGALNQYIERDFDALMRRTEQRPLPSGRLTPGEVLLFGSMLSVIGILELLFFTNFLTGFLAALTLTTYLFLYTPLKRITPWSTIVGGIPGALPPVIGVAAVRNEITVEGWILFGILFFWQMPHFFSLAWMYRRDYARAGYRLLTVVDPSGSVTSLYTIVYCSLLLGLSVAPWILGLAGVVYMVSALGLGGAFLATSIMLRASRSNEAARRVFFVSLAYLPVLLLILVIDRI